MQAQTLLEQLDSELWLRGSEAGDRYAVDWSATHACRPNVVLRPRNTEDIAAMLRLCHAAGQAVVVQGGLTGLSGGATPQPGEWALSMERLNRVFEIDSAAMTITVGAGTPLELIQTAAAEAGFRFPLDLGARGSCLAGGVVSTNAGGNQVIQFGMTRALVLGLVAVLADGTVIPARNKLLKNNSGFDVKQLFIGTEGALGVVTEVTFRLFPQKPYLGTALCVVESFAGVVSLLQKMGRDLEVVSSFEVMWPEYYREALRATGINDPLAGEQGYCVLIETEGASETAAEHFLATLSAAMEEGLLLNAIIAQSSADANTFWAIRDGIAELLPEYGPAANFDIGIPIALMERFIDETQQELKLAFPDCRVLVFGHLGDGNLHLLAGTGREQDVRAIYDLVYRKIAEVDGAISAEHGIGVLKKEWLAHSRSAAEIALMRSLKSALDPAGILNPGRVV